MVPNPDREARELVRRCLAAGPSGGAPGADSPWDTLAGRFSPAMAAAIRSTLARCPGGADPAIVQDLVQESFVRLLRDDGAALRRFAWSCSLETYLSLIASRCAVDHLRRGRERVPAEAESWKERLTRDGVPGAVPGAPAVLEGREAGEALERAIGRLSPRDRLVLRLFYWDGVPLDRIAGFMKIPIGTLGSLMHRARERLKALLKGAAFLLF